MTMPKELFVLLIDGALVLSAVGAVVLIALFVRDVRTNSTW